MRRCGLLLNVLIFQYILKVVDNAIHYKKLIEGDSSEILTRLARNVQLL